MERTLGDPTHEAFWKAARDGVLVVQRCGSCGHHQFYGRSFCLRCDSDSVAWTPVGGGGTVYSATRVRRSWMPHVEVPYIVAVVELDEGVRLVTNIVNGEANIGDRVRLLWRQRAGLPPIPVFEPCPSR